MIPEAGQKWLSFPSGQIMEVIHLEHTKDHNDLAITYRTFIGLFNFIEPEKQEDKILYKPTYRLDEIE